MYPPHRVGYRRRVRQVYEFTHASGAVLRNLQTMSESTQRLSEFQKAAHPQIDWHRIAAFRNLLVHNYLGIDPERAWEIAQRDVPELKRALLAMLQGLAPSH
jgi:uncharacterized protein with HEPN domain